MRFVKNPAFLLLLLSGISACSMPVGHDGKTGGSVAENASSDCGTIMMVQPVDVRGALSRDLDCRQTGDKNTVSQRACFQYTVLLDHGGSFIVAQSEVPSMMTGKRVCIAPGASSGADVMRAE